MLVARWYLLLLLPIAALAAELPQLDARLPPRPSISDYQDRAGFVADILLWKRQRDELAAKAARGELPPLSEGSQARHDPDDWHHITGPEDLDTAIRNAHGYVQPEYQEPLRFNRTTHISFPLEHLPAERMANETVDGALGATPPHPTLADQDLPQRLLNELDDFNDLTRLQQQPAIR